MKTWGDALAAVRDAIARQDWDRGEQVLATMRENAERWAEPGQLASVAFQQGMFEDARGRLGAAEAAFAEAVSWDERAHGAESQAVADALRSLGLVRARMKKTDLAVTSFEQASGAYATVRSSDAIETMTRAGRALADAGRYDEAIARYAQAEGLLADVDTPACRAERAWALVGRSEAFRRTRAYAVSRELAVRATWLGAPPTTPALDVAVANAWLVLAAHARHVARDEKLAALALVMARTRTNDGRVRERAEQELAASPSRGWAPARIAGWVVGTLDEARSEAEVLHPEAGLRLATGAAPGLAVGAEVEVTRDAAGYRIVGVADATP